MAAAVNSERRSICSSCGREFSAGLEYCPLCMLSGALAAGAASAASSCEAAIAPPGEPMAVHFEHYELLQAEDGRPVELGRGAMGITYKAFDVDLQATIGTRQTRQSYGGSAAAHCPRRCLLVEVDVLDEHDLAVIVFYYVVAVEPIAILIKIIDAFGTLVDLHAQNCLTDLLRINTLSVFDRER
jgi:hypothetical protein